MNLEPAKPNGRGNRSDAWLTDVERRVAHMHLAGARVDAIAQLTEYTTQNVSAILARPNVQKYMLRLEAAHIEDMRPRLREVSDAIADSAEEARMVVLEVMREMRANPHPMAQRIALASAQDILDRAGHKAPIRVEEAKVHAVHPDTLRELGNVIREVALARGVGGGGA